VIAASGVALILLSLLLGSVDVLRAGVFAVSLPLLAVIASARTQVRLSVERRVEPGRVPVGGSADVVVRASNASRVPTGVLLVRDEVPDGLGGSPRFVLDRLEGLGHREVRYRLDPRMRGRYEVGPLEVRISDPFGVVEVRRRWAETSSVVVTPQVVPLAPLRLGGDWTGGGEGRPREAASWGEDDVAPREYRSGDDLRRVNWRATARHGELMVRREEQPWQNRAAVLLDGRAAAHRGVGAGGSYEAAVRVAASAAAHLLGHGFGLRVVDERGVDLFVGEPGGRGGGPAEIGLLDVLAEVAPGPTYDLDAAVSGLRRRGDAALIAVLGRLTAADAERLARLAHGRGPQCLAIVLDVPDWPRTAGAGVAQGSGGRATAAGHPAAAATPGASGRPAGSAPGRLTDDQSAHRGALAVLASAGWRVCELGADADLTAAWLRLGEQAGSDRRGLR
jgi:uncharacterized protein (DUF58 family)